MLVVKSDLFSPSIKDLAVNVTSGWVGKLYLYVPVILKRHNYSDERKKGS